MARARGAPGRRLRAAHRREQLHPAPPEGAAWLLHGAARGAPDGAPPAAAPDRARGLRAECVPEMKSSVGEGSNKTNF